MVEPADEVDWQLKRSSFPRSKFFSVWILCDSIKLHTEFFMMPAFTPSSKVLREKDINDLTQ